MKKLVNPMSEMKFRVPWDIHKSVYKISHFLQYYWAVSLIGKISGLQPGVESSNLSRSTIDSPLIQLEEVYSYKVKVNGSNPLWTMYYLKFATLVQ